jgi:hypothetical protein
MPLELPHPLTILEAFAPHNVFAMLFGRYIVTERGTTPMAPGERPPNIEEIELLQPTGLQKSVSKSPVTWTSEYSRLPAVGRRNRDGSHSERTYQDRAIISGLAGINTGDPDVATRYMKEKWPTSGLGGIETRPTTKAERKPYSQLGTILF